MFYFVFLTTSHFDSFDVSVNLVLVFLSVIILVFNFPIHQIDTVEHVFN